MKRAVETILGKLPPKETPHPDYLATKLEEVEQDELMALTFDMVAHAEEQEVNELISNLEATGRVQVSRSKAKGKLPVNSEEFRMKIRIEAHVWLMLAAKFRNKVWLQGLTVSDWSRFTDFILGDKVRRMQIPLPDKNAKKGAPKGDGRGAGAKSQLALLDKAKTAATTRLKFVNVTLDGTPICYAFNGEAGCQTDGCARAHVCKVIGCLSPDHGKTGHEGYKPKGTGKGQAFQ
ncbi:unnamed protein product [Polarella glacialis]|uniref:Uncharacterized protein n=1 Tax=Polarella glacialis TaxID=89957 RepID=A0A813H3X4_POLGL|nr:unnamed protein product [Polarella glacialis]CAE8648195.1 unnamed protein product [Polarella glacialis]